MPQIEQIGTYFSQAFWLVVTLRRIVDRTEGALKEVLLVLDASTGQNWRGFRR